MHRAIVIRTYGDKDVGDAIVNGMVSSEIKLLQSELNAKCAEIELLRSKLGMTNSILSKEYRRKIYEIDKHYPVKSHNRLYHKLWGYYGLVCILVSNIYN